MGSVNITLANGQLGQTIQTEDGIMGMVLTGAIDGTGDYALGTPILVTSTAGLTAAGITSDGNEFAVRQVTDFYKQAGAGAQLYLMLVPNTMLVSDMADLNNEDSAKKLLDYAAGKIKVLGIMSDDEAVHAGAATIADALNEEVYTAITNMEVMAAHFVALQQPFRCVIGGTSYSGVPADLADLKERSDNRCAVLVGDTQSGVDAALGLLLGTIAALPVMRKISRVANGALPITAAYLATDAIEDIPYDAAIIEGKAFITWKQYPHKAGYFFSGDPMATGDTDDYKMLARGRVIDKAHILAYKTFIEVVDDEVPVDPTTGKLSAGYCRSLEQSIENQLRQSMTERGEISEGTAYVNPEQNVLSTNTVAISIGITAMGYSTTIEIALGYVNPAL